MRALRSINTRPGKSRLALLLITTAVICGGVASLSGQDDDPAAIAWKSRVNSWPTFNGDYSGQRHSPLTQITVENVNRITLAWAFQSGQNALIKSSPILVDGILYITVPDNVWAIDAVSGRQIWHYTYPPNQGLHIGQRGVAAAGDSIYLTTPDCHVVSLDAKNGKVKWDVEIADSKKGYWMTMAPLVIRNHMLVGTSGDIDNLPGMLKSIDPHTGETQWVFFATPLTEGAGAYTGGQMWMTGTYDPALNLAYVGTANPTPVLNGQSRKGDNLWTNSIVALNPDTGKLVWGFQPSPHDTHDWDAVETPVLADAMFGGKLRKLLMQASRNGYFFVLDRATGRSLHTSPFATVNWSKGVAEDGRPIPDADKEPAPDGRLVAPNETGATNYRAPSFDSKTGLFIVSAVDGYGIFFFKSDFGSYGWAGADYNIWGKNEVKAIDYQTGEIRWRHAIGSGYSFAGILTTDGGLTFTGDTSGNAMALRTDNGATLWHSHLGDQIGNSPITYELEGRQYVLMSANGSLYSWTLPKETAKAVKSRDLPRVPGAHR